MLVLAIALVCGIGVTDGKICGLFTTAFSEKFPILKSVPLDERRFFETISKLITIR